MPRVSAFYGIVIYMHWRDHNPPHFHAIYADSEAIIRIDSASLIAGSFPTRALRMVREWAELHKDELEDRWQQTREHKLLLPIDPLA